MIKVYIVGLILFTIFFFSCGEKLEETTPVMRMQSHVYMLASDSFRGREAGTPDEINARDYIVSQLKEMGLKPYFGDSFYKKFSFKDGADFTNSSLAINDLSFEVNNDYYPLNNSKSDEVEGNLLNVGFGIMSSNPSHNDYPNHSILDGKIYVMEMSVPGGASYWNDYAEYADLDKRIELASKFGAKAIILINSDSTLDDPRKMISNKIGRTSIPVIIAKESLKKYLLSHISDTIRLKVSVKKIDKTGYNIAAIIDNDADKNIILGAHYDHLGMGGETSRYHGPAAIHNGADDNASGVASILELAYELKDKPLKYNIIIMSFSGEEKGLLGSAALIKNHDIDRLKTVAMLNFDMVGRLDSAHNLTIFGTGTANEWDSVMNIIHDDSLNIKAAPSGIGGSDQMSFYLDSIPVLFFFTGFHTDYHTPADDAEKINYKGMKLVIDYAKDIIDNLNGLEGITYHVTKARTSGNHNYRKGPTLGIVPDYGATGGMTINAVLEGKSGQKAGLKKGDIIIKIGEKSVDDIYDYMDALKLCSFGKTYQIVVRRNGEEITKILEF